MPITVNGPLATPVVNLSLQDGGSLDPDTVYYVRVVAWNDTTNGINYLARSSSPSTEQFITTSQTQKSILVDWSGTYPSPTGHGFNVYVTKVSGDYRSSLKPRCGTASYNRTAQNANTYLIAAAPTQYGWDTFTLEGDMPYGLDKEAGSISIDGSGTLTLQDIYDAVIAAGYPGCIEYHPNNLFHIKGGFRFTGSSVGELKLKKIKLLFCQGGISNENSNFNLQFGEYNASKDYAYNGCYIIGWGYTLRLKSRFEARSKFYGCYFDHGDGYDLLTLPASEQAVIGVNNEVGVCSNFKHCNFENIRTTLYQEDVSNIVSKNMISGIDWLASKNLSDFECINSNLYCRNGYTMILTNGKVLKGNQLYHMTDSCGNDNSGKSIIIRDCNFDAVAGVPENMPRLSYYSPANPEHYKEVQFTLKLKIKDNSGNPLPGAVVTIKDVNGDEVPNSPYTADENGEIEDYLKVCEIEMITWDTSNYILFTPHSLTIAKSGYQTYKDMIKIDRKMDLRTALKRLDYPPQALEFINV